MAVVNSSTFDFTEVVRKFLDDYEVDVFSEVSEAIDEVSKEAVRKLRATSRATFGPGDYSKKWKRTLERGRVRSVAIVHGDKPTYALAHLLEHGHVTRNGTGRTFKPTPEHVHIEPVAAWAADEAVDRAISKLEKRA